MSETKKLSSEQVAYVMGLPTRTVIVSNNQQTIAYDEEKKIVFFLDDRGFPTGRAAKVDDRIADELKKPEKEDTVETRPTKEEKPSVGKDKETESKSRKKKLGKRLRRIAGVKTEEPEKTIPEEGVSKKSRKKSVILLFVCASFICVVAWIQSKGNDTESSSNGAEGPLEAIDVIQVTTDLIPGDLITTENIQKVTISSEVYNQISLSSVSLYQWSRSDSLIDSYAVEYIPKGCYLTYNNVNAVFQQPGNPWEKDVEGKTFVSIPIPEDVSGKSDITYGSMIDLTIVKETVLEVGEKTEETEEAKEEVKIEGLEHKKSVQQSSQVDTYGLSQVVVCDLLDESSNSLYPKYTSWISIPSGEQHTYLKEKIKENDALLTALSPSFIRIQVTDAQAKALGDLTGKDVQVKIKVLDKTDQSSDAKSLYTAGAKSLVETVESIQKELAEEAKGGDADE